MARNRRHPKANQTKHRLDESSSKMHARTERMHTGVRLGFCVLALMGCSAFMVAMLPEYRKLESLRSDLSEVQSLETEVVGRVDAKDRERRAIETDPEYRELIARDRLNYYKPGEHIFRLGR